MNTLGANMVREGSSRLPAPLDGYFGSGACVDAVGIPHCITLETSPSGCPYQPDQCSQVEYFHFKFLTARPKQRNTFFVTALIHLNGTEIHAGTDLKAIIPYSKRK